VILDQKLSPVFVMHASELFVGEKAPFKATGFVMEQADERVANTIHLH
jgi:hypothetical protein